MNLFSSLFSNNEKYPEPSRIDWIPLTRSHQLDEIDHLSSTKAVLIFKHSTRCGISRMVLKDFEKHFNLDDQVSCYFLDLLTYRELSNEVASRFKVMHQSPQLLLIKAGECVYDVSHNGIDAKVLAAKL